MKEYCSNCGHREIDHYCGKGFCACGGCQEFEVKYSFCESTTASSTSPWHIRTITNQGKKLSGGVDTPSLCGIVKPPYGWDLEVEIKGNEPHACKKCVELLKD